MAKPSLTNIILFYNMSIGRKELFIKKCNIWLISLDIKEESRVIFNLPKENSIRTIIKYLKLKETSSKYPRRYSEIIKKDI